MANSTMDVCFFPDGEQLSLDSVLDKVRCKQIGGIVFFLGTVRDHNKNQAVSKLHYEAYPEMVTKKIQQIFERARQRWENKQPLKAAVHYRAGEIKPGEISVIIAVGAAHREEAFSCCRFLLEKLKSEVPIWKKEFYKNEASWIQNRPDSNA